MVGQVRFADGFKLLSKRQKQMNMELESSSAGQIESLYHACERQRYDFQRARDWQGLADHCAEYVKKASEYLQAPRDSSARGDDKKMFAVQMILVDHFLGSLLAHLEGFNSEEFVLLEKQYFGGLAKSLNFPPSVRDSVLGQNKIKIVTFREYNKSGLRIPNGSPDSLDGLDEVIRKIEVSACLDRAEERIAELADSGGRVDAGKPDANQGGGGLRAQPVLPEVGGAAKLNAEASEVRVGSVIIIAGQEYRILRVMDGGGTRVYHCRDAQLDRDVALREVVGVGEEVLKAREDGMRALARLKHEDIPAVHGILTSDGGRVFAMVEWVEGRSLKDVLEDGAMKKEEILRIARGVVAILRYSHGRGIFHQDIKPSNIIIRPDGRVSLIDWDTAGRTASGFGTPAYAAPEVSNKPSISEKSDVYSVGVTLYERVISNN